MKNNYLNRGLQNGLKALAFLCVFGYTNANAQTVVPTSGNLRTVTNTTYAAGSFDIISSLITVEGVTFNIQATLTPNSALSGTGAYIMSNANNRYGVDGGTLDGNLVESIAISNLKVVNFDSGTTTYTVAAISDLRFTGVTLYATNGASDQPVITIVGGTSPGAFNIGQTPSAATSATIVFGTPFVNNAGTSFTVGSDLGVSGFTISNGSTNTLDAFQIIGSNWSLNFTKNDSLGVNTFETTSNDFIISPNPALNSLSLNKAIQSAEIIDMAGRVVKAFRTESDNLDVSQIPAGAYILKGVSSEGTGLVKRFIKK